MNKIPEVEPRPYLMENTVQHYAWGTRGRGAYIPALLGIEPQDPTMPYAELWMGAHPKAPSRVHAGGQVIPLDTWIAAHPRALLGDDVTATYGETLPFLYKVLSAGQSLSIQAHPNKAQAEALHARDPEHYPDANHKPEIAVALESLTALMGFRPWEELVATLQAYPALAEAAGEEAVAPLLEASAPPLDVQRALVRGLVRALVRRAEKAPAEFNVALEKLAAQVSADDEREALFLELRERYPGDVGLAFIFLLNLVHLEAGQGLYTEAGVPHAYLRGNIVECMANSDNVVRVGLTPKYKDAATLLEILDTTPQQPQILPAPQETPGNYATPAEEFVVRRWALEAGQPRSVPGSAPSVLLVTAGEVLLRWKTPTPDVGGLPLHRGQSVFLPALLDAVIVEAVGNAIIYEARAKR